MKRLLLLALASLAPLVLFSQPAPDTLWTRTYHEMGNTTFADIQPSFDGGMVIMGNRTVYWDTTIFYHEVPIVATNASGDVVFESRLEGGVDAMYGAVDQCRTTDGDSCYLFLTQRTREWFGVHHEIIVTRADRGGTVWWSQTYGDTLPEFGAAIVPTTDNNYMIVSAFKADTHHVGCNYQTRVRKITGTGTELWAQTYQSECSIYPQRAIATSDGGCLVAITEYISPYQAYDLQVLKADANGNEQWRATCFDAIFEQSAGLVETADGYVVAVTWPENGLSQVSLIKLGLDGQRQWLHSFSHEDARNEIVTGMVRTADGGFLLSGYAQRVDALDYPMMLIKADENGEFVWRVLRGTGMHNLIYGICEMPDGWMVVGANEALAGGWAWPLLAKFGPIGQAWSDAPVMESALPARILLAQNYPNPFNPATAIAFDLPRAAEVSLAVYDVLGQQVATLANGVLAAGHHTVSFSGGDLPSGSYFCTLTSAGVSQTRKMMLLK